MTIAVAAPAQAQAKEEPPPVEVDIVGGGVRTATTIAIPAMPTQGLDAGLGTSVASVIASDLRSTGAFTPLGPQGIPGYPFAEASNPAYATWRGAGAQHLVSGYLESAPNGSLTLACFLFDVTAGRELVRQGFAVTPANWRRAAVCALTPLAARAAGPEELPRLDLHVHLDNSTIDRVVALGLLKRGRARLGETVHARIRDDVVPLAVVPPVFHDADRTRVKS